MRRIAIAVVVVSQVAAAQGDTTKQLETVVVTATHNPMSYADVPASVTILNGGDLRARGVTSVSDALREVPGVAIARTGSFGGQTSLFVRGGQSNYTKILIDGVPMNQSGGAFDLATLTTDNVERIEVVRGPSSVVWGSDAVTGVVNIITRHGVPNGDRMYASVRGGTYGSLDAEGAVMQGGASSSYSLGLARHQSDGIYAFNNQFGETVLTGRGDVSLDDKTTTSFTVRYSDFVAHYPTDGTGAPVDSNAFNTAAELALGARIRRTVNARLSLQGAVTSSAHDGGTDDAAGQGSTDSFETVDHITRRGAEGQAIVGLATGSTLTVGGRLEEQAQRSQSQSGGGFSSASVFNVARHEHAAFAELVSTASHLTGTAGFRVDGNEQFGSVGTFRAAGVYAVASNLSVRAGVGTSFREPSLSENFATGFTVGNPDLKPEHAMSWEAGASGNVATRLGYQVTYFNQRFDDLIDYDGAAAPEDPNYQNIAKATANGVEIELYGPRVAGFRLDVSATKLMTEVVDRGFSTATTASLVEGQRLLRRPDLSGSARVNYARGLFSADLVGTYIGNRDDRAFTNSAPYVAAVTLPAVTLLDVSANYAIRAQPNQPRVRLTVRAANLGDVQYESVAGYRAPGRQVFVGAAVAR